MGKSKRARKSGGRNPLDEQIEGDKYAQPTGRVKQKKEEELDEFVDADLSARILKEARKQQTELEDEHGVGSGGATKKKPASRISLGGGEADSDEDSSDAEEADFDYEHVEIDEEDEAALKTFMSATPEVRRTLGDIIQEKITEKKTEILEQSSQAGSVQMQPMDDRVVAMYRSVRDILRTYRSGKLPKAFKVIPSLMNWEQVLNLTEPDLWTAAAMYEATRIFVSNLNARMAQRFFNLVLYPRIRDDIAEFKKLNFHLYMALKKALFKPAAFFKGILLPLCNSGTCTLREATIVASVLAKCTIPMLHSAAAILKIAEADYNGANSIFLRTLLDKKYALPFRVVDAVVHHFLGFTHDKRKLPVLWHQCLLTFMQRYKQDVSSEQKEALLELMRNQSHELITPEVRREMLSAKCRDEESAANAVVMDDDF